MSEKSHLTKEEKDFHQNLQNLWAEISQLVRNPPPNLKFRSSTSAQRLFANVTQIKQIMDEMSDYVTNTSSLQHSYVTSVQTYLRQSVPHRFRPFVPQKRLLFGDLSQFARLLLQLSQKLTEIRENFISAYGLQNEDQSCTSSGVLEDKEEEEEEEVNEIEKQEAEEDMKVEIKSSLSYVSSLKEYINLGLNQRILE